MYFASLSGDLLVLHVVLVQDGGHDVQVHGRNMDVHIDVDGHQLGVLGPPEVHLQMAPKSNT